ncbi:IS3-like element ISPpu29 family transposase [Pseudomonas aeruginosa]|uniref:IS3-like element ISPpu29 family transposase n=1 Tax=Pseudomonas aeruginosa TaxID=287 RepID=UPI00214F480D|nr:IS3-like element ISPpu29 family transposase [Pseudomonas aeruginosa]UUW84380.1 IS3-like element ISPpu29 family transposase [Pseudomonas aeruginosa]WME44855.1 IS3-like element ISPpu29 family transposase [Pseudomonas aeruginosa]WME45700.1 IS3-like element ISPpu29 family transposase [Pseudomonas aeruginosa]WME46193.1 IS3-like element ISPpu29 family transposase [Pseudomonas aeruginosa]WME47846.1 IS3-like element ISPpu29 family transposase [Pseudomonas aeruginosa]
MGEAKKRKVHTAEFKAKVGLEAVRGVKTITEIAQAYGVHPQLVGQWKKEILESAGALFETKRGPKPAEDKSGEERLYGEIGRLKMENDWLKKVGSVSLDARVGWVDGADKLSLSRQCELAEVPRATVYRRLTAKVPEEACAEDLLLCRLIDEEYTSRPFYGSRRMVVFLRGAGHVVNRKRVQRLMRGMGLAGMAPGPNTSKPQPQHKVYPYLLRGVAVTRPNQVWSTDITYIRLARGFAYLVAVIDWYSRKVLSWRLSNSMDASFCVDCLEDALREHGRPEVFNSDQGSQFTSAAFTGVLKREGVAISMDGRGRALDNIFVERLWRNVKHEDVYLKGYANMAELTVGLAQYFAFYNAERPHQSLGYKTPASVYRSGIGGGALIADKYGGAQRELEAA